MKLRIYRTDYSWKYFMVRVNRSYQYFCVYFLTVELLLLWGRKK